MPGGSRLEDSAAALISDADAGAPNRGRSHQPQELRRPGVPTRAGQDYTPLVRTGLPLRDVLGVNGRQL
jgi:hypothetical protein